MNEQIKIGSIIKQIRGVSYKPTDVREADEKNAVALLRANNIQETGLNFDELVYIDRSMVKSEQYLRAGDILICSSSGSKNLVGKAAYVPEDLPCSFGAFCKVVRTQAVDSYYLGQYFQSPRYRQEISEASAGANINNIRNEHIDELTIPAHSKSEQMEIVQILLCLNKQIDCTKQHLEKLDELVKSRFIELFDGKHETKPLQAVCEELFAGGDVKKDKSSDTQSEEYPYPIYTNGEKDNGLYGYTSIVRVAKEAVTISGRGTIGFTCLRKEPFYPAVRLIVAVPKQELVNGCYLQHFIQSKNYGGQGASIPQLTVPMIKDEPIPVPPMELQKQFTAFVEQTDKSKLVIQESLAELETLKKALMQKYFG